MNRRLLVGLLVSVSLGVVWAIGRALAGDNQPAQSSGVPVAAAQIGPLLQVSPTVPGAAEPGPSAQGDQMNPHQLPPQAPGGGAVRETEPRPVPDPALFGQLKARANAAAAAQPHLPSSIGQARSTPARRFPGLGSSDGGGWNPPDAALAVGPSSVLTSVNESFAVYTLDGTRTLGPVSLQSFFGSNDSVFDPRAIFDAGNAVSGTGGGGRRFVLLAASENDRSRTSSFMLAVSQNDSPESSSTGWCRYRLNAVTGNGANAAWADFPDLGMDGNNLYITSNQFTFSRNGFVFARILVLPKSSVYPDLATGACPTARSWTFSNLQNPGGSAAFTAHPAHQPDALPTQAASTMNFVNAIWPSGNNLVLRAVTQSSPGATPLLHAARWVNSGAIGTYDTPADAPQPSGTAIDTGDSRLLGAVQRYGKVYTASTTQHLDAWTSSTPNPAANGQWYEITPISADAFGPGWSHAISDPAVAFYFPGVIPGCGGGLSGDACGTPFVGFEVTGSSADSTPASVFLGRDTVPPAIDPSAQGVPAYALTGRWGDYPAVSSDPAVSSGTSSVWFLGEFAQSTAAWGTDVAVLRPQ